MYRVGGSLEIFVRVVPQELEGENRSEQVEINLVDRRQVDYKPPTPPAYTAFSGTGQTMGYVTQSIPRQKLNPIYLC